MFKFRLRLHGVEITGGPGRQMVSYPKKQLLLSLGLGLRVWGDGALVPRAPDLSVDALCAFWRRLETHARSLQTGHAAAVLKGALSLLLQFWTFWRIMGRNRKAKAPSMTLLRRLLRVFSSIHTVQGHSHLKQSFERWWLCCGGMFGSTATQCE